MMPLTSVECPNCSQSIAVAGAKYCPYCGAKVKVVPLSIWHLLRDTMSKLFSWDNAFWTTFKTLWIQPQQAIRAYIAGQRKRYLHPISYLLIISLILSFTLLFSKGIDFYGGFFDGWTAYDSTTTEKSLSPYYTFITLLCIPLFSLFSKLLYYKNDLNYAEHLVVNTYWYSHFLFLVVVLNMIYEGIFYFFSINESLDNSAPFIGVLLGILFLYTLFLYYKLFSDYWLRTVFKTSLFFASSLIVLSFMLSAIAIVVWGI